MKYYSEKLNKVFNTSKECVKAEDEFEKAKALEKELAEKAKVKRAEEKAEHLKLIEEATNAVKIAQDLYKEAEEEVEEIYTIAKKKGASIAKEAVERLDETEKSLALLNRTYAEKYNEPLTSENDQVLIRLFNNIFKF